MALIQCKECGKTISDKATSCPHCGCPVSKGNELHCPECGNVVTKTMAKCPNCGAPLQNGAATNTKVFGILGVAALIIVLVLLLQPKKKADSSSYSHSTSTSATKGTTNGHDWVDLGLSVKWAACNVGASSPYEYGDYYAWAETETKNIYKITNTKYFYVGPYGEKFSKYVQSKNYFSWGGQGNKPDNKLRLDVIDDVASQKWGGLWRIPSYEEWKELIEKCTWKWCVQNGQAGYNVTGRNGSSIFLPASGRRASEYFEFINESGYYWSRSLGTETAYDAWSLTFGKKMKEMWEWTRDEGFSIRPVIEKR